MYAAETSYHPIKRESSDFNRHDTYENKEEQTKHYLAQHYTKNDHNPQFDSKYNSQATSQYSQNSQNSQNSPNSDNHQTSIQLNDNILRNFGVAKKLDVGKGQVNSISFNSDGKFLVAGCHDDTITLFDVNRATKSLILNSKKYGVEKITFTRDDSKVLYSAFKNSVRPRNFVIFEVFGRKFHCKNLKNYQIELVGPEFLNALYASNKVDDAIRYQSLEDNKYRIFTINFKYNLKCHNKLEIPSKTPFFITIHAL